MGGGGGSMQELVRAHGVNVNEWCIGLRFGCSDYSGYACSVSIQFSIGASWLALLRIEDELPTELICFSLSQLEAKGLIYIQNTRKMSGTITWKTRLFWFWRALKRRAQRNCTPINWANSVRGVRDRTNNFLGVSYSWFLTSRSLIARLNYLFSSHSNSQLLWTSK